MMVLARKCVVGPLLYFNIDNQDLTLARTIGYQLQIVARAISEPSGQASIEYPVATTFIINNQILRPTQTYHSSTGRYGWAPLLLTPFVHHHRTNSLRITASQYNQHKEYIIVIRLVKKRSVSDLLEVLRTEKVKSKESILEARLKATTSHDDIEATSELISVKDPISKLKIEIPVRSIYCTHIQCFDAETYISFNQKYNGWKCPVCNKQCPWDSLFIDQYFQEILKEAPPDMDSVLIKPDGSHHWENHEGESNSTSSEKRKSRESTVVALDSEDDTEEIDKIIRNHIDSSTTKKSRVIPVVDLTLSDDDEGTLPIQPPAQTTTQTIAITIQPSIQPPPAPSSPHFRPFAIQTKPTPVKPIPPKPVRIEMPKTPKITLKLVNALLTPKKISNPSSIATSAPPSTSASTSSLPAPSASAPPSTSIPPSTSTLLTTSPVSTSELPAPAIHPSIPATGTSPSMISSSSTLVPATVTLPAITAVTNTNTDASYITPTPHSVSLASLVPPTTTSIDNTATAPSTQEINSNSFSSLIMPSDSPMDKVSASETRSIGPVNTPNENVLMEKGSTSETVQTGNIIPTLSPPIVPLNNDNLNQEIQINPTTSNLPPTPEINQSSSATNHLISNVTTNSLVPDIHENRTHSDSISSVMNSNVEPSVPATPMDSNSNTLQNIPSTTTTLSMSNSGNSSISSHIPSKMLNSVGSGMTIPVESSLENSIMLLETPEKSLSERDVVIPSKRRIEDLDSAGENSNI